MHLKLGSEIYTGLQKTSLAALSHTAGSVLQTILKSGMSADAKKRRNHNETNHRTLALIIAASASCPAEFAAMFTQTRPLYRVTAAHPAMADSPPKSRAPPPAPENHESTESHGSAQANLPGGAPLAFFLACIPFNLLISRGKETESSFGETH